MAWDEWEQLKSAAAERQATHMELNQLPGDPGPSSSDSELKSKKSTWAKAGHDVRGLRDDIGKALTKLEEGQNGLGKTSGCQTASAQHDVHESWKQYVTKVSKRCGALADVLEKAGNEQLKTDHAVGAELDKLKAEYRDTPAVGGKH